MGTGTHACTPQRLIIIKKKKKNKFESLLQARYMLRCLTKRFKSRSLARKASKPPLNHETLRSAAGFRFICCISRRGRERFSTRFTSRSNQIPARKPSTISRQRNIYLRAFLSPKPRSIRNLLHKYARHTVANNSPIDRFFLCSRFTISKMSSDLTRFVLRCCGESKREDELIRIDPLAYFNFRTRFATRNIEFVIRQNRITFFSSGLPILCESRFSRACFAIRCFFFFPKQRTFKINSRKSPTDGLFAINSIVRAISIRA